MFDATTLRKAFGCFTTGAAIVTMVDGDGAYRGMTINSLSSLSLDPPLLLWSIARSSRNHDAFTTTPQFAIHVLKSSQEALARGFGSRDGDRFEGVPCDQGLGGVPLLAEHLLRFQCVAEACHPGGDHTIIVGRVVDIAEAAGEGALEPLVLFRSRTARLHPESHQVPVAGATSIAA